MLFVRSALFNTAHYLNLALWLLLFIPLFVLPRMAYIRVAQAWARSALWLQRVIAGTRVEFRGLEKIPPGGLIFASKHQSAWETFAHFTVLNDPAFILKRELMWVPLFGWYAWKGGMIPVNRGAGSAALADMNRRAREEVARGRQIIIYPEGTRRPVDAPPSYKYGIAHLYATLGVPVVPVALNSGLFWPRRRFLRWPGTIVVEILDPIPPGLDKEAFFARLQETIETASNRLLAEGRAQLGLPQAAPPAIADPARG